MRARLAGPCFVADSQTPGRSVSASALYTLPGWRDYGLLSRGLFPGEFYPEPPCQLPGELPRLCWWSGEASLPSPLSLTLQSAM